MDLDAIRLFCETIELGSFAAAARKRGVDPTSVSRAVASLEAALGVRLIQRTTRRLSLTEAGAAYLERVGPLLQEFEQAASVARDLSGGPAGTLRVTASFAFGVAMMPRIIDDLTSRHPKLTVAVELTDSKLDLVAERIDVAVRHGPRPTGDFIAARLSRTRYRLCASEDYLRRAGRPETPQDLERHACLLFGLAGFRDVWTFKSDTGDAEPQEIRVSGPARLSAPLAQRACARHGLGIALLADWLSDDDLANGALVELLPDYVGAPSQAEAGVWAIYPSRAHLPLKTQAFIDAVRAARHVGADSPVA